MTQELFQMLQQEHQSVPGAIDVTISEYEGYERIYFLYYRKEYATTDQIITVPQIATIAQETFSNDVRWGFYPTYGDMKNVLKLFPHPNSPSRYKYQRLFEDHDFEFGRLDTYLHIAIDTGTRGRKILIPRQRELYKNFITKIVAQTIQNTTHIARDRDAPHQRYVQK